MTPLRLLERHLHPVHHSVAASSVHNRQSFKMAAPSCDMTLDDVLHILSEHGIMHIFDGSTVILGNQVPLTLPAGEDRQHPGAAELIDLYSRMGWKVLRAVRDAEMVSTALQHLNDTGLKYRWSDLGPEGCFFALPFGDVPSQPTPEKDHKPSATEMLLREEGWTVLATYSRPQAQDYAATLGILAQHHLILWKQVEDNGCFLLAARLPKESASEVPQGVNSATDPAVETVVTEEDAMLESYYRSQNYVLVRISYRFHYKLCSGLDGLRERGMHIRYTRLTAPYNAGPDTECVVAVHCGPFKEPKYGGRKSERDAALRKDGWAVLVTFSPEQAANVRKTLERMHAHGVPLEWRYSEEGKWGTHIHARCNWPIVDDERHEGDDAIIVASAADDDAVRHGICQGLRDLDSAGMGMQWRLRDGVITVSPWDAF